MVYFLFGVLHCFQHCTGHTTTGSWKGRGNQYIQFVKVLYCKLPTNGKQLPAFPLEVRPGFEPYSQRWEASVLPLRHCGPHKLNGCKILTFSIIGLCILTFSIIGLCILTFSIIGLCLLLQFQNSMSGTNKSKI